MTQTIEQITDFSTIEDAIEAWVLSASGLSSLTATKDSKGNTIPKVRWAGFDLPRKRPYAVITIVSQPSQGHPWSSRVKTDDYVEKTYSHPFAWNTQISFFTDSYDENGAAIRATAYRFAQNTLNRAFLVPAKSLLDAVNIAYAPMSQNIQPGVLEGVDSDKYIHQASVEFTFSGIAQTKLKDTDWFETITVPTEANSGLTLSGA
ncbi:hypothetical protein KKI24_27665 [bacterium]|nr:hypothetical protein [bacterium]